MKNKDYWHKRFIELENQNTNKTAKYYENLEKQFKNANKKIEAETQKSLGGFGGGFPGLF